MQNKQKIIDQLSALISSLAAIMADLEAAPFAKAPLRVFELPINGSMLRQNLVVFNTDYFDYRISGGEKFTVVCPKARISFETDLVGQLRLRERGQMNAILTKLKAKEGDYLAFKETSAGCFEVSLRTKDEPVDSAIANACKHIAVKHHNKA